MAYSLNKVMLIGNLGNDSETRFTTSNLGVSTFSLATTRSYKGKDGNWVNETTWHSVVCFNLPDFYKKQLLKGKKFYVEGRITKEDYTDKEGIKRYVTKIISEKLIPLSEIVKGEGAEDEQEPETTSYGSGAGADDDLPF